MYTGAIDELVIFQGLKRAQLNLLCGLLIARPFAIGQIIFHQGDAARDLFFLADGEVEISYKPYDGPALSVAHIVPGGVFGWSAALHRETYTANAIATLPGTAFQMGMKDLRLLCHKDPDTGVVLLNRLASAIAERVNNTYDQVMALLTTGMDIDLNRQMRSSKK